MRGVVNCGVQEEAALGSMEGQVWGMSDGEAVLCLACPGSLGQHSNVVRECMGFGVGMS